MYSTVRGLVQDLCTLSYEEFLEHLPEPPEVYEPIDEEEDHELAKLDEALKMLDKFSSDISTSLYKAKSPSIIGEIARLPFESVRKLVANIIGEDVLNPNEP